MHVNRDLYVSKLRHWIFSCWLKWTWSSYVCGIYHYYQYQLQQTSSYYTDYLNEKSNFKFYNRITHGF